MFRDYGMLVEPSLCCWHAFAGFRAVIPALGMTWAKTGMLMGAAVLLHNGWRVLSFMGQGQDNNTVAQRMIQGNLRVSLVVP